MTARITAAPAPIRLEHPTLPVLQLDMHPLSDQDLDALDEWVQYKMIELVRKSMGPEVPYAQYEITLRAGMREASSLSWTNGSGLNVLDTPPGRARLLWQSCKKSHPELSEEQLRPYMRVWENADRVIKTWQRLNGMVPVEAAEQLADPTSE